MTRDYMGKSEVDAERKERRPRRMPPVKMCPNCYMIHIQARRICDNCRHEFYPSRKSKS